MPFLCFVFDAITAFRMKLKILIMTFKVLACFGPAHCFMLISLLLFSPHWQRLGFLLAPPMFHALSHPRTLICPVKSSWMSLSCCYLVSSLSPSVICSSQYFLMEASDFRLGLVFLLFALRASVSSLCYGNFKLHIYMMILLVSVFSIKCSAICVCFTPNFILSS